MLQKLLLFFMIFLISGCSTVTLKRSANNKLIDSKGFHGSKRRPVYNKKYISKAKMNVKDGNYDEEDVDDDDEITDPSTLNRSMYRSMLERERKNSHKNQYYDRSAGEYDEDYPRLSDAHSRSSRPDSKSEQDMQKELVEIKKMLANTQKDMVKYRCPLEKKATPLDENNLSDNGYKPSVSRPKVARKTHSISSDMDD